MLLKKAVLRCACVLDVHVHACACAPRCVCRGVCPCSNPVITRPWAPEAGEQREGWTEKRRKGWTEAKGGAGGV